MRRREFIAALGGSAAWPLAARGQQTYRLGILSGRARQEPNFVAFFDELPQFGVLEGQQLTVDSLGLKVGKIGFPHWRSNSSRLVLIASWAQATQR